MLHLTPLRGNLLARGVQTLAQELRGLLDVAFRPGDFRQRVFEAHRVGLLSLLMRTLRLQSPSQTARPSAFSSQLFAQSGSRPRGRAAWAARAA
jgi:hypothetical protein